MTKATRIESGTRWDQQNCRGNRKEKRRKIKFCEREPRRANFYLASVQKIKLAPLVIVGQNINKPESHVQATPAGGMPLPLGAKANGGIPLPLGAKATGGMPLPLGAKAIGGMPLPLGAKANGGIPLPLGAKATGGMPLPLGAKAIGGIPLPLGAKATGGMPLPLGAKANGGIPLPLGAKARGGMPLPLGAKARGTPSPPGINLEDIIALPPSAMPAGAIKSTTESTKLDARASFFTFNLLSIFLRLLPEHEAPRKKREEFENDYATRVLFFT
jgi:hypothetical protein